MITPPHLERNDLVGIVSTARKITTSEIEALIKLLENWGLKAVTGMTINAEDHQYAGDDDLRTKDFQSMMDNPRIKAIWCARGGYGTVRIIDKLNFIEFVKNPKWIIGYSDVTVFHSHIHRLGIETLHANMAIDIDTKTEETRTTVASALFGKKYSISYEGRNKMNRTGVAEGSLVGGNLSLLYSLIGSPSAIDTSGKILFIEDLDEMRYHVDRMMQSLKRSGLLANLKALVVGGLNDMRDNTIPFGKTVEQIISETVSEYSYPVCFDFPAGHIQDNRALIMGRTVQLSVENEMVRLDF